MTESVRCQMCPKNSKKLEKKVWCHLCPKIIETRKKSLVSLVSKQLKEPEKSLVSFVSKQLKESEEKVWCPLCPNNWKSQKKKFGVTCVQRFLRPEKKLGVPCVHTLKEMGKFAVSLVSTVNEGLLRFEQQMCPQLSAYTAGCRDWFSRKTDSAAIEWSKYRLPRLSWLWPPS